MGKTKAYAAYDASTPFRDYELERQQPKPTDVQIDILYCGVCHSDLHQVRNEWGGTMYPIVPCHEIVGRVSAVGNAVTKFKVGDLAGVAVW
jgi:alcohol dehydrogenase (NADP+)